MSEVLSIQVEDFFPYAPARVWKALTDQGLLAKWLMPSDFQLTVGHKFTFKAQPIPSANFDGYIHGTVLEVEPERRLKMTWGEGSLDTTVLWELSPEGTGTRLLMVQDGFDANNPMHQLAHRNMSGGWRTAIFPRLARFLAEETVQTA